MRIREIRDQGSVKDAIDRGIRADAEGKRQNGNQGESRILS
jgi:hypothetical protein